MVAAVDRGTTRYVVEQAPAGEACYRIAARADEIQSFFSPAACVHVRTAAEQAVIDAELAAASPDADSDGAGVAASTPPPCAPVATDARPISATAIAILWKPATKPPAGWSAPDPTAPVLPSSSVPGKESSTRAAKICDPSATITGWTVQRKIFTGWSDVSAAAKPNDTAIEVTGLEPDTKYCFRMNAQSADGESKNTKKFCTTTRPVIEASSSPDTAGAVSPSASGSPAGPAN